jgi:hypothetical protein
VRPILEPPPLSKEELDRFVEEMKKDVDRTLIRENLKLTVEARLVQLMRLQEFAEEMRRAGRATFGR